ncbi:MAG: hypothetical protein ABI376_00585, partial [Caulobacteraceae bacterium]
MPGIFFHRLRTGLFALGLALTGFGAAHAVPAFAVQTGQPCSGCHVGGFGPQLTPFGREFKMGGYTLRTNGFNLPVSAMAVASYIRTQEDQPGPPPRHYGVNDNVTLDQASLFLAGGAGDHLGAFVQATYDGVARAFHWDNLDLRAVTKVKIGGGNAILGVSLNNAPAVTDAFNTLPAWAFPYTTSSLAPGAPASPLIGQLAQNTLGITAYAWVNSTVYAEFGGYQSPSSSFLIHAGVDPTAPGSIRGVAPYARLAWNKNFGTSNIEVGAFGLWTDIYPGLDRTTGQTDNYADTGVDASYQYFSISKNVFTLNARYIHEQQSLYASRIMGLAQNGRNRLEEVRMDASYYWRNDIGVTVGLFDTWGSADTLLYAGDRTFTPNTSGLLFQVDGTPFGGRGSPLGPRFNLRVGAQ